MKSLRWIYILFFTIFVSTLFANNTVKEDPFPFWFPSYLAQGNSTVAYVDGFGSLLSNPANFALPEEEFTLFRGGVTLSARQDARIPFLRSLIRSSLSSEDEEVLSEAFTAEGIGMTSYFGLGYVGRGLGLGFLGGMDVVLGGEGYPFNLEGEILTQFMLVVGYATKKEIGPVSLFLGGDIRPMIRIHAPLTSRETSLFLHHYFGTNIHPLVGDFYSDTYAFNGSGIGIGIGLLVQWGYFSMGVSVRDLFDTQLFYSWNDLSSVRSALARMGLPPARSVPEDAVYTIPTQVIVGFSYFLSPMVIHRAIQARIHGEWVHPFTFIHDPSWDAGVESLRGGMELLFFSTLGLRGGVYKGAPTYGIGLQTSIFELNIAFFTRNVELGSWNRKIPAASVELGIRW